METTFDILVISDLKWNILNPKDNNKKKKKQVVLLQFQSTYKSKAQCLTT